MIKDKWNSTFKLKKIFLIEVYLTYNIALVLGVQHTALIYIYIYCKVITTMILSNIYHHT